MSGVLEKAIEYLQAQQKSMESLLGGGTSGGIGDLFGGGTSTPTSQPSTMEAPIPPVTAVPPVTATQPQMATPAPVSTPTPPTLSQGIGALSSNPSSIGTYGGGLQFGSMTGNFNDPNRINSQGPQTPEQTQQTLNDIFASNPLYQDRGQASSIQGQNIFNNPVFQPNSSRIGQIPPEIQGSSLRNPTEILNYLQPQVEPPGGSLQNSIGMNPLFGRAFAGKPI